VEAFVEKSIGQIGLIGDSNFGGFGHRGVYMDGNQPAKYFRAGGRSVGLQLSFTFYSAECGSVVETGQCDGQSLKYVGWFIRLGLLPFFSTYRNSVDLVWLIGQWIGITLGNLCLA
jgi:hypothetical protein